MTTNLRPTTPYLLRTPEGFIHNIDRMGDAAHRNVDSVCESYTLGIACPHNFTLLPNTRGPWMATASGRRHYFLDPHPSEIVIEDIAHALSNICRYGGHARQFYSVAEHSVRVAEAVRGYMLNRCEGDLLFVDASEVELAALLHDASEAYLGDLVNPLKQTIGKPQKSPHGVRYEDGYCEMEDHLSAMIYRKFCGDIPPRAVKDLIRHYDLVLLKHEARALIPNADTQWEEWSDLPDVEDLSPIEPWSPSEARVRFMTAFAQYGGTV